MKTTIIIVVCIVVLFALHAWRKNVYINRFRDNLTPGQDVVYQTGAGEFVGRVVKVHDEVVYLETTELKPGNFTTIPIEFIYPL